MAINTTRKRLTTATATAEARLAAIQTTAAALRETPPDVEAALAAADAALVGCP